MYIFITRGNIRQRNSFQQGGVKYMSTFRLFIYKDMQEQLF